MDRLDSLSPEYQPMEADFPSVDEPSRDRDERADNGKFTERETPVKNEGDKIKNIPHKIENPTDNVEVGVDNMETAESANEIVQSDDMETVEGNSDKVGTDQSDRIENLDKTSIDEKVDKVNHKSIGSKEVMPRKRRSINKIIPRRKRGFQDDYELENENSFDGLENKVDKKEKIVKMSKISFGNISKKGDEANQFSDTIDLSVVHKNPMKDARTKMKEKSGKQNNVATRKYEDYNYEEEFKNRIAENDFDEEYPDDLYEKEKGELDGKDNFIQEETSFRDRKHQDITIDTDAIDETNENHSGEEFDEDLYKTETRKETKSKLIENMDENQGGESMDDYDEDLTKEKIREVEKLRHAQKYHSRGWKIKNDPKVRDENKIIEGNIDMENDENVGTDNYDENKIVNNNMEDYIDDEKYNYQQYLINLERSEGKRDKRNKEREEDAEEVDDDNDNDEETTDDMDNDDNDDDERDDVEEDEEKESGEEHEKDEAIESEDERGNRENDNNEEEDEDIPENKDSSYHEEEDDEDDDDSESDDEDEEVKDERNTEERMVLNGQESIGKRVSNEEEKASARNTDDPHGRKLIRKRRSISPSSGLSRNVASVSRHRKYFHGPNHKKKESMQEKWWKYIMLTNSEDWQIKKKNILREENKLKEEKRKLEERHGNFEGSHQIENRTKDLEKRNQQLKDEEDNLMKHIPSKKMVNLDEQFLNYVKKSLGLKNNDSSISNYDVDDVEQLWDDFIESNVLNHRGYGDDYEFNTLFKDKSVIDIVSKDGTIKKSELQNSVHDGNFDKSKQMVSYNLHVDKGVKPLNNSKQEKLMVNSQNSKLENNNFVDENDLQQKFKHYTPLDQLKLINRMKNNRTKHNRVIKNNIDNVSLSNNKFADNMSNDKNLKVILKNGENFKYNDYYKWKDNSEYVNFDSYYNIMKNPYSWDSNDVNGNTELKHENDLKSITFNYTIYSPQKLFSSQNNQTLTCNSYFFKRRLVCENDLKSKATSVSDKGKSKHPSKKQNIANKIRKKLHEKIQANLGIKHVVVNDSKSENKGRAIVIEKINYKFPFNFGKEKIYSEKDLELIFNNETHAEIKKIMKLNLKKINDSITKIKNGSHHWSNYYKYHKLISNKSENDVSGKLDRSDSNEHSTESTKHLNRTTKEKLWFNTLHTLKNKQFLKHLKTSSYKTNRAGEEDTSAMDRNSNHIIIPSEQNANLITKKIDLQNNIEQIHISELKNSKNKTKSFPYRRRDKTQDKSSNENRIENLFGLTDSMMAKKINETGNKTENTVLGLPVGGKYASHLNWHEKKYGLPLRNKWESTTEVLANSQRHHRLLKVKKRSLADMIVSGGVSEMKDVKTPNLNHTSKFQKRSTVKKDLSETLKASSFLNDSYSVKNSSIGKSKLAFEIIKGSPQQLTPNQNAPISSKKIVFSSNFSDLTDLNLNKNVYEITPTDRKTMNDRNAIVKNHTKLNDATVNPKQKSPPKTKNSPPSSERDNIVKRSVEKYLKILPRASSTPLITSSLTNDSNSVDIIFVSFWVPPKSDVKKLSKSQLECVEQRALEAKSIECYNRFGDSLIKEEMAKQCIGLDEGGGYNQYYLQGDSGSQFYNPLNLRFGQLSIYRIRIKCKQCDSATFESLHNQGWPSGGGQMANGVFGQKHRGGK